MANYFQLPNGVRVAGPDPIDGDRYIAADIAQRDLLVTNGRAQEGQQCYVEATQELFILKGTTNSDWELVEGDETDPVFTAAEPNLAKLDAQNIFTAQRNTFGDVSIPITSLFFDYAGAVSKSNLTFGFTNNAHYGIIATDGLNLLELSEDEIVCGQLSIQNIDDGLVRSAVTKEWVLSKLGTGGGTGETPAVIGVVTVNQAPDTLTITEATEK